MGYGIDEWIQEEFVEKGKPLYIDRNNPPVKDKNEFNQMQKYLEFLEEKGIYEFNRTNGRYEPGENYQKFLEDRIKSLNIQKKNLEQNLYRLEDSSALTSDKIENWLGMYNDVIKDISQKELLYELYNNPQKTEEEKRKQ